MGITRGLKRAKAKEQYRKFSRAWAAERRYQQMRLSSPDNTPPEGVPLGRCPTFSQWMDAVRSAEARASAIPEVVQEHINDVQDLDWKEE